ncbi:MAG: hypothetical protein ABFC96_15905 [Thermoguttaceae bacterium]
MKKRQFDLCLAGHALLAVAVSAFLLTSTALAQAGGGRGGRGGGPANRDSMADRYRGAVSPSQRKLTLHGGQYLATDENRYEIVYMPLQTRIYLYDKSFQPLSARDLHAEMSLQLPDEREVRHLPFRYAPPARWGEQDYVVAVLNVAQLNDRETPITFQFTGLPDRQHPTATFTPVFTSANVRPYVTQVLATKADTDAVVRQRVCPVCGQPLGVKRPVVKVLIAEFPLYLCDEECIAAVRETPRRFLPQPQAQRPNTRR